MGRERPESGPPGFSTRCPLQPLRPRSHPQTLAWPGEGAGADSLQSPQVTLRCHQDQVTALRSSSPGDTKPGLFPSKAVAVPGS